MRRLWKRYLAWRNRPSSRPIPVEPQPVKKVAVDDAEAIMHIHANRDGSRAR